VARRTPVRRLVAAEEASVFSNRRDAEHKLILSGMLKDGSLGLMTIKEAHGLAMVQSPNEALFKDMPRNAIEHDGAIDFIGAIDALAREICREVGFDAAGLRAGGCSTTTARCEKTGNGLKSDSAADRSLPAQHARKSGSMRAGNSPGYSATRAVRTVRLSRQDFRARLPNARALGIGRATYYHEVARAACRHTGQLRSF
jgi:hypothetical protein